MCAFELSSLSKGNNLVILAPTGMFRLQNLHGGTNVAVCRGVHFQN